MSRSTQRDLTKVKDIPAKAKDTCRGPWQDGGSERLWLGQGLTTEPCCSEEFGFDSESPENRCSFTQRVTEVCDGKRTRDCRVEEWTSKGQER